MKTDYYLCNLCAKKQAIAQLSSHEDATFINISLLMFYDMNSFINLLRKKYPPSTIMKFHSFTVYLQDLTCVHVKIASNTTKVLVHNLMKDSYKRAKLLIAPILTYILASLQERIMGITPTDMYNLGDYINDAILTISVTVADIPLHIPSIIDLHSPLPLGSPPPPLP